MIIFIVYELYKTGKSVKNGKLRVKNCDSLFHAKVKTHDYLKRHYDLDRLEISKCEEDFLGIFSEWMQ